MEQGGYMMQPNSEAAQFFAAQNAQGGGGGGGGGSGQSTQEMFQLMEKQFNLGQRGASADFDRQLSLMREQNNMEQSNLDANAIRDRKGIEEMIRQKSELLFKEKNLEFQLAQADHNSEGPLRQELLKIQQERDSLDKIELESNYEVGRSRRDVYDKLNNYFGNLKTHADTRKTFLEAALTAISASGGGGLNSTVEDTLDKWRKTPNLFGGDPKSFLNEWINPYTAEAGGVERVGEWIGELFTGDTVADTELRRSTNLRAPGVVEAAMSFNNGVLRSHKGLKEWNRDGAMVGEDSVGSRRNANVFASNFLSDVIMSGLNSSNFGQMNPSNAQDTIKQILDTSLNLAGSVGQNATGAQEALLPLLKKAAVDIFGNENNVSELVDYLDAHLKEIGYASTHFGNLVGQSKTMDSETLQNAATSFALNQAKSIKYVLDSVAKGQILRSADYEKILGGYNKTKMMNASYDKEGNLIENADLETIMRLMADDGKGDENFKTKVLPSALKLQGEEEAHKKRKAISARRKVELEQNKHNMDYSELPAAQERAMTRKLEILKALEAQSANKGKSWY